jgi:hypothetical protein
MSIGTHAGPDAISNAIGALQRCANFVSFAALTVLVPHRFLRVDPLVIGTPRSCSTTDATQS